MFKALLKKIATEYKAGETYFGGDVEEDLCHSLAGVEIEPGMCRVPVSRAGYIHALYDLGVIEALPAPAEGEVRIHTDRARLLLRMVAVWTRALPQIGDESEEDALWRELLEDYEQHSVENVALENKLRDQECVIEAQAARLAGGPSIKPADEEPDPSPAVVRDALLLVGIDIPLDIFAERTNAACAEALEWARKAHLNASDCTVEVPACPEWVANWRRT